jgi:hypothetical protein
LGTGASMRLLMRPTRNQFFVQVLQWLMWQ